MGKRDRLLGYLPSATPYLRWLHFCLKTFAWWRSSTETLQINVLLQVRQCAGVSLQQLTRIKKYSFLHFWLILSLLFFLLVSIYFTFTYTVYYIIYCLFYCLIVLYIHPSFNVLHCFFHCKTLCTTYLVWKVFYK